MVIPFPQLENSIIPIHLFISLQPVYTLHYKMYNIHYTLYKVCYSLYTTQYLMHNKHFTFLSRQVDTPHGNFEMLSRLNELDLCE